MVCRATKEGSGVRKNGGSGQVLNGVAREVEVPHGSGQEF